MKFVYKCSMKFVYKCSMKFVYRMLCEIWIQNALWKLLKVAMLYKMFYEILYKWCMKCCRKFVYKCSVKFVYKILFKICIQMMYKMLKEICIQMLCEMCICWYNLNIPLKTSCCEKIITFFLYISDKRMFFLILLWF